MKFFIGDLEKEWKMTQREVEKTKERIIKRIKKDGLTTENLKLALDDLAEESHKLGHVRGEIHVKEAYRSMFEENGYEYDYE